MSDSKPRRKLAAILAADVVGFSKMMGENEDRTLKNLKACRSLTDESIISNHGRIFGSAGDSIIAEFASPVDAVIAATEFQRNLKLRNEGVSEENKMMFRVGLNLGDVIVEGDNLYGDGVNVASRLEALAEPGGITLSGKFHDEVSRKLDMSFVSTGEQEMKNIQNLIPTFKIELTELEKTESGGSPEIIDPVFLYVQLTVFVKYDPNLTSLTSGELTSKVRQVISTYNDTNLKKFDGVFRHSQILGEIDSADASILNSTVNVGIQKRLVPTIGTAKKYTLDYNNGFFTNIGAAQSIISSTTFTLNGQLHQFQDTPITTFSVTPGASTGPYAVYGTENANYAGSKGYFYPLYTTAAAANAADIVNGGLGNSHTHTFLEFTGITFYMPSTFANHGTTSYDSSLYELFQTDTSSTSRQLQIFRLSSTNQKIITVENAGSVDVVNGIITITSFNPEAITGSYITITATPNSNDIAPQRQQLIEIDMNNVTVTPQIDTVATGGAIAGVGYTTTPNYGGGSSSSGY